MLAILDPNAFLKAKKKKWNFVKPNLGTKIRKSKLLHRFTKLGVKKEAEK